MSQGFTTEALSARRFFIVWSERLLGLAPRRSRRSAGRPGWRVFRPSASKGWVGGLSTLREQGLAGAGSVDQGGGLAADLGQALGQLLAISPHQFLVDGVHHLQQLGLEQVLVFLK
jgi:hypothetical protein